MAGSTSAPVLTRVPRPSPGETPAARRDRQDQLATLFKQRPDLRGEVVAELLPLVRSLARRYKRGEEPFDDLVQVGSLGLLKALERFDVQRGTHFVAFAMPTITGEIRRHYRDTAWAVHVPRSVQELARRVSATERDLALSQGRSPTVADIARELRCDEEDVTDAWLAARGMRTSSLDQPGSDDVDPQPRAEDRHLRTVDAGFDAAEDRATLAALQRGLSDRERHILSLRYDGDLSQREIGREVGLSQMQISRLLGTIHQHLKAEAGSHQHA